MPMDLSRYPPDWKAISLRIREREGWCCKWCGVKNGAIGYREKDGTFVQLAKDKSDVGMDVEIASLDGRRVFQIILTVAHLGTPHADGTPGDKHDKLDVRDENLAALCQRCHLLYDLDDHIRNAAATRHAKRLAQGQQTLF